MDIAGDVSTAMLAEAIRATIAEADTLGDRIVIGDDGAPVPGAQRCTRADRGA
ncbi:hypothetical protein JM654_18540 [Microbacterium oxydans]|nr:hypothetical protein [Microbacterium oxydans]